jgi:hypothetical protein
MQLLFKYILAFILKWCVLYFILNKEHATGAVVSLVPSSLNLTPLFQSWEDNINMDFKEIVCEDGKLMELL